MESPFTTARGLASLLNPHVGALFHVPGAAITAFICAWHALGRKAFPGLQEHRCACMAEGYARVSRKAGAIACTSGPGATNLATGSTLATTERTPVIYVAGDTPRAYAGRGPVQEFDILSFARTVAKRAYRLEVPEQLRAVTRQVLCSALEPGREGATWLIAPCDLLAAPCDIRAPLRLPERWSDRGKLSCARALAGADLPLIIAGRGVVKAGCTLELRRVVDFLPRAAVVATPRSIGVIQHPRYSGVIGFGGNVDALLDRADAVLVLGSSLHEMSTSFDDRLERKPIFHIDIDWMTAGQAYDAVGLVADLRDALPELIAELKNPKPLTPSLCD